MFDRTNLVLICHVILQTSQFLSHEIKALLKTLKGAKVKCVNLLDVGVISLHPEIQIFFNIYFTLTPFAILA